LQGKLVQIILVVVVIVVVEVVVKIVIIVNLAAAVREEVMEVVVMTIIMVEEITVAAMVVEIMVLQMDLLTNKVGGSLIHNDVDWKLELHRMTRFSQYSSDSSEKFSLEGFSTGTNVC